MPWVEAQDSWLKKGAPGDQVWDLLCVQLASYLERGPLMWMMHLHVNQKSDYDIMIYSGIAGFFLLNAKKQKLHKPFEDQKPYLNGYSKTCFKQPLKNNTQKLVFDTITLNAGQKYCRMLQREHSAILSTFIKLLFSIKAFVLSIFKWPLKTGLL